MEKRESGNGEKRGGRRERRRGLPPNCQNPDASRVLSSLKCVLFRHISRERSTVAIVAVPSLLDSSRTPVASLPSTLHPPPPLVQLPKPQKRNEKQKQNPLTQSIPLLIPSSSPPHHHHTHQPPPPQPPQPQAQAQKKRTPVSTQTAKAKRQDARGERKREISHTA